MGVPLRTMVSLASSRPRRFWAGLQAHARSRRAVWAVALASLVAPVGHPVLLPIVGVPSHLLWFVHVLAVAITGYLAGLRLGLLTLLVSAGWVLAGERWFGMGYWEAADWPTAVAMMTAVAATNALVLGFAVTVRATERRRREVASVARAAMDAAPDPLLVVDADQVIRLANLAAARLLEMPVTACIGTSLMQFLGPAEGPLVAWAEPRTQLLRRPSGAKVPVDVRVVAVTTEGAAAHWLVVLRDNSVALRRAAEEQRLAALAELGQLVSAVAHELNNPLAGMLALAEGLTDLDGVADIHRETIDAMRQEAVRAAGIARRMLASVRGAPVVEDQRFEIGGCLDRVHRTQGPILAAHGTHLQMNTAPGLESVLGSAGDIEQVLVVLVTNARQAVAGVSGATVAVTARRESHLDGPPELRIEVEDNGPGVPTALREQIFESFFTTKSATSGTGLGLSIARRIARSHGGELRYEAGGPLDGARFVITLPIADLGAQLQPTDPPAIGTLEKGHVLLIEDEPALARGLSRLLSGAGLEVTLAGTVAEAREHLRRRMFDVVVSDVHLPDGTGIDLHRAVTAEVPALRGRWVFMTGEIPTAEQVADWKRHGEAWLAKPTPFDELRQAITAQRGGQALPEWAAPHAPAGA